MNKSEKIPKLTEEVLEEKRKFSEFKKRLIIGGVICIPLLFIYPYLPGRRGRPASIETMEYNDAILFTGIIWIIVIPLSYFWKKEKFNKKIRALNLKKKHLEDGNF